MYEKHVIQYNELNLKEKMYDRLKTEEYYLLQ